MRLQLIDLLHELVEDIIPGQLLDGLAVDEEVPPDLLETLQMVALTLNGLKEECE